MSADAEDLSPAQRYALSRQRTAEARTELTRFRAQQAFDLDEFQLQACRDLEAGRAVLVAAPTGAGKTIVGEFAVHLALASGRKAFYTTPIKALSNQKYQDLVQRWGSDSVGLLTGDTSVNPDAQVVVMTTEVLRNMLYQDAASLQNLGFVVMDEVHYLADRFRGAVWEEVIIHLPEHVQVAALSATVSNAEEFGDWLDTVRGETSVVVSEHRPVPLWQHMALDHRLFDLFVSDRAADDGDQDPTALVNPDLQRAAQMAQAPSSRGGNYQGGHRRGKGPRGRGPQHRRSTSARGHSGSSQSSSLSGSPVRGHRLNRPRLIRTLDREGLLPCISFIFSRAGCEAAVEQCVREDLRLTNKQEAAEITSRVEEMAWSLPSEDLSVLGFDTFREALIAGVAAHHAGMLPAFKELVEELFADGLLKVVFATETLALGINMPARTVVLEKLDKFNGESHVDITPGEFTQLTGRAGRRGIDVEGHAVVIWQPGMDPRQVAGLASKRTYPLNSSFSPSYNMAVNLTAQFGRQRARTILESSFAQFQADRSVVGMARDVAARESSLDGYDKAMQCHLGDFGEYAALRRRLNGLQKEQSKARNRQQRRELVRQLTSLEPGDVIEIAGRRRLGTCLVVHSAPEHDPRPGVITEDGKLRNVSVEDFSTPPEVLASIRLPRKPQVKVPKVRRDLASTMRAALRERTPPRKNAPEPGFGYVSEVEEDRVEELEMQLRRHPCHSCSDREEHARWADRWWQLRRETAGLKEKINRRTGSIAKTFDRVCGVLFELGHLSAADQDTTVLESDPAEQFRAEEFLVTPRGQRLRRIYGERDLFTEILVNRGALAPLDPEELAAFSTVLVYQAKREDEGAMPTLPTSGLRESVRTAMEVHDTLAAAERRHHVEPSPAPELGLCVPMFRWARGESLRAALDESPLAAGDFVRWAKQCMDVLDQLSSALRGSAGDDPTAQETAETCRRAVDLISRGVVAYSSVTEQKLLADESQSS